jgi:hypothetical protein
VAKCVKVESGLTNDKTRFVKYHYDDGTVEMREGGHRAWRNKNPGNLVDGRGALGKDYGGSAIFPDVETGRKARRALFEPGGKSYDYDSVRRYSDDPFYGTRVLEAARSPLMKRAIWQYDRRPPKESREA